MFNDDESQSESIFKLWQGYCYADDIELTDHDQLQLYKLLIGKFSSVDYEHINGFSVQCIRCSDKRRILFSNVIINSKLFLKVERILENHTYQEYYRHVYGQQAITVTREKPLTITTARDITAFEVKQKNKTVIIPVDQTLTLAHYNQSVLALNNAQINAGKPLNLPCLIEGAAGAGKTLTLFLLLSQLIEQLVETASPLDKDILLITPKNALNELLRTQWYADNNPLSRTQAGQRVIFLSEDEFYQRYSPMAAEGKTPLSTETFLDIIRTKLANTSLTNSKKLDDPSLLHEFQIMATCHGSDEYLNLGERESYLSSGEARNERQQMWETYLTITNKVMGMNAYTPYISRWEPQITFYAVLHDEAQAGYLLTKFILRLMTENVRYLLCAHSVQSTDKKLSIRSTLIKKLGVNHQPLPTYLLSTSYRNPRLVSYFNEAINQLRRSLGGGALDKSEAEQQLTPLNVSPNRGTLSFIPSNQLAEHLAEKPANNVHTVVITRPEYIEDAIERFGTGYVSTPANFGGQERKRVYLYRLTECAIANQANDLLEHIDLHHKDNVHLPKAGKANAAFNILFNELYTGSSRAEEELYFVERPDHKRRFLLAHLTQKINALNNENPITATPIEAQASAALKKLENQASQDHEWLEMIDKLLLENDIETAKRIWRINLKRQAHTFDQTYLKPKTVIRKTTPKKQPVPVRATKDKNTKQPRKTFYEMLDEPNPPSVKLFTESKNGVIILHELLLQDKNKFRDYFNENPGLLLKLTAQDWLRHSTRSLYRPDNRPLCLLALVLDQLCEHVIPNFMIRVFSQNQYQLFSQLSFETFSGFAYISERFPAGKSCIQLLLESDKDVTTERQINLATIYLNKHKHELYFIKQDDLWFYDHLNLGLTKNRRLANVLGIKLDTIIIEFIRRTFSSLARFNALSIEDRNNVRVYEFILTIDDFSTELLTYCKELDSHHYDIEIKEEFVQSNIKQLFTKRISLTHMTNVKGIIAPFFFHMLHRAPLRALLGYMFKINGRDFLFNRKKSETITLGLLTEPYPAAAFIPPAKPVTTNCLRLLANIETIPLFLDFLINTRGVLEACLSDNNFLFETEVQAGSTAISLLYLFHREVIDKTNLTGFQQLVEINNYLLLTHAPKDFILTIADYYPQRSYGHLLFENPNFDFIDHYYNAVKGRVSEREFSNLLFEFLFETSKITNIRELTTFVALARDPANHDHLLKLLKFMQPHQLLAPAISRCLSEPNNVKGIAANADYYLWNGLATLLSDNQRREFMVDVFLLVPETITLLTSETWSHPDHPDILLRALISTRSGLRYLRSIQDTHPHLLFRALNAEVILASPAEQAPPLDTIAMIREGNENGLKTVADYITSDPIGYFLTREELKFEVLISSVNDSQTPMMTHLALNSARIFTHVVLAINHVFLDLPTALWFPINEALYPRNVMASIINTTGYEQLFFTALASNRYQILNRLSFRQLNTPILQYEVRGNNLSTNSILDYLIANITSNTNDEFAEAIIDLLESTLEHEAIIQYIVNRNHASHEHLSVNNLFFFCFNANLMRFVIKHLAIATEEEKNEFVNALSFTPEQYQKHEKTKKPWSPLAMLIQNEDFGISTLFNIFISFPEFIRQIPLVAWSSPLTTKDNYLLIRLKKNLVVPEIYNYIIQQSDTLKAADAQVQRYIELEKKLNAMPSQVGHFATPTQPMNPTEPTPCLTPKKQT